MAKKETAGGGVDRMDPELAFAGFEPDPIDDEDFSEADRGHDLADDATVEAQRKANEEEGEGEHDIPVVDKDGAAADDGELPEIQDEAVEAAEEAAEQEEPAADEAAVEVEAAGEEAETGDSKPKGQFIPKSRFDEVNERRKKAEEELARLKAEAEAGEQAEQEEYDFEAKEKEYMNLVLDGEHDKAAALRSEIRVAEQAAFMAQARNTSSETTQEALDKQKIEAAAAEFMAEYPAFDHTDQDNFRADLLEDVGYQTQVYVQKGFDRPSAFRRAVSDVIKLNDLQSLTAKEPATEEAPAQKTERRSTAKKVEAAAKQPANIATAGKSSADAGLKNVDIEKISDADLEKLPEETVRRLRGDYM